MYCAYVFLCHVVLLCLFVCCLRGPWDSTRDEARTRRFGPASDADGAAQAGEVFVSRPAVRGDERT